MMIEVPGRGAPLVSSYRRSARFAKCGMNWRMYPAAFKKLHTSVIVVGVVRCRTASTFEGYRLIPMLLIIKPRKVTSN